MLAKLSIIFDWTNRPPCSLREAESASYAPDATATRRLIAPEATKQGVLMRPPSANEGATVRSIVTVGRQDEGMDTRHAGITTYQNERARRHRVGGEPFDRAFPSIHGMGCVSRKIV